MKEQRRLFESLRSVDQGEFVMPRFALVASVVLFALSATPAGAQHVISNPGWCAQFYPNANCQNLGPGNPYTSYGWATNPSPRAAYWGYHHHPHYWRR
jgi:hypothetical protein